MTRTTRSFAEVRLISDSIHIFYGVSTKNDDLIQLKIFEYELNECFYSFCVRWVEPFKRTKSGLA